MTKKKEREKKSVFTSWNWIIQGKKKTVQSYEHRKTEKEDEREKKSMEREDELRASALLRSFCSCGS